MTDIADDYSTWDAPYVLGSLTRAERREYEEHLAGCPVCRASVADLAVFPGLLAMVEPDTALAMIEPPETTAAEVYPPTQLLPRLADAAAKRRRRGRWAAVGAAAAAAAAAVAIAVPVVATVTVHDRPAAEHVVAERVMDPLEPTPVSASFKLIDLGGGQTKVEMTCSYGPSNQNNPWRFTAKVRRTDGTESELAGWTAGPGDALTISRVADVPPDKIHSVEIKSEKTGDIILRGTV
ncbi:zf-HC2 domain-containing protein [Nocardia sp. NPDC049707]|uniref:anti-sigma factor family protein n=1 Tax=Nocardia sp. NPDC049707 TaxID=3154735 RepID=UPI0034486186